MTGRIDAQLKKLGLTLPEPPGPAARYVPYVVSGSLVFISGQLPMQGGKLAVTGKLGSGVSVDDGAHAAKLCAINILAQLKSACGGDLDRVKRCMRLNGFVASAPDFTEQPRVVNGASDLIVEVLGDAGRHSRVAVGVASLPLDAAVDVDGIFEIE
jgi:enamine deaminase RidA (YjgF/YER057c/UK114 family)